MTPAQQNELLTRLRAACEPEIDTFFTRIEKLTAEVCANFMGAHEDTSKFAAGSVLGSAIARAMLAGCTKDEVVATVEGFFNAVQGNIGANASNN